MQSHCETVHGYIAKDLNSTGPEIVVRPPEDDRLRFIIDSVATYVMVDGCAIEQALMTKEAQNPEFMFLFDLSSPEHAYYRWKVYSLAQVSSQFST